MTRIPKPNYTQIPNVFFDEIMQELNQSELKVMMVVMRKTFGWQKRKDRISYSQIQEISGLSKQAVSDGLKGLTEKGYIVTEKNGQSCTYCVAIDDSKPVNKIDRSRKQTGQDFRPEPVKILDQFDEKPVKILDTQKKEYKETIKEISGADAQSVFSHYFEKYKSHYNNKPVCNVGRFVKQIKTMLDSSSPDELKGMIDYIWKDEFVSNAGHSAETVFSGTSVSKFRARIIQSSEKKEIKHTCEHCGSEYTDFCRNPTCPGYL